MIEFDKIKVPYLNHYRTLRIYLPDDYMTTESRYPVIYMHDAQNLFDPETSTYGDIWDVHTHINTRIKDGHEGLIVVGIDNHEGQHNRLNEYSPWVNSILKENKLLGDIQEDVGGLGGKYIDFIVNDLKPYIDQKYRTIPSRENTAIIGSSMGGLISLYAGLKYPNVFSKIGAFSSAIWFAETPMINLIKSSNITYNMKWYMDIGTEETSNDLISKFNQYYLEGNQHVFSQLESKFSEQELKFVVDQGGIHNEKDWSKRFPSALKFLYK